MKVYSYIWLLKDFYSLRSDFFVYVVGFSSLYIYFLIFIVMLSVKTAIYTNRKTVPKK